MSQEIGKLVRYRLDRANEAVREAELLLTASHVNTCVNRLYYACFYAVSAYLLAQGYISSKHAGLRALLHQKMVKPGLVSIAHGHLYDRLYDSRQRSDYADLVSFDANDVSIWLEEVRGFVEDIGTLAEKK